MTAQSEKTKPAPRFKIAGKTVTLPRSRALRIGIGVVLITGGFLGFLPVLGFWMIPAGLAALSYDWPLARRWTRQLKVWFGRWFQKRKSAQRRR